MKPPSIRTSFSTAPRKLDPKLAATPAAVDKIAEKLGQHVMDEDAGPHGDPGPSPAEPPKPVEAPKSGLDRGPQLPPGKPPPPPHPGPDNIGIKMNIDIKAR